MNRSREDLIRRLYQDFNARRVDDVLAEMTEGVDWPNALEGTRIAGHEAVREYWRAQFAAFDPRVEPVAFEGLADGRLRVRVVQRLFDLDGDLIGAGEVFHDYTFDGERIAAMEIVAAPGG